MREAFLATGLPENQINTTPTGPGAIAFSKKEFWKVEYKGSGTGTRSTQRNNFDRALASTVTYYDEMPKAKLQLRLGLALPATPAYLKELQRVGKPLRKRLDLWMLLLDLQDRRSSRAVPPDEEIPDD